MALDVWVGFGVGVFVGAFLAVLAVALMQAAARGDAR